MAENPSRVSKLEWNTIELPPTIEIKESSIISGQAGAFAKTLIAKDTKFGPYKGEIINAGQKDYIDYRYAWEVFEKDSNDLKHTISALHSSKSNWMRHVNCARFYEEQNIISTQEEFSIFYVAMKDIKPGEELLTWFDPKLLKRTKRRLSKMGRKPVGYTIELVPWSDEKKFVPEIIDTKRKRKKKVLSDMISLDENPLVLTRTLQSLSKIPSTPRQLGQSSLKNVSLEEPRSVTCRMSQVVSPAADHLLSKAKKGSKPQSQNIVPRQTENKSQEQITARNNTETIQMHEETGGFKSVTGDLVLPTVSVEKGVKVIVCSPRESFKTIDNKGNKSMLLKKNAIKLGRAKLQLSTYRQLLHVDAMSVRPVIVKRNADGSTSVEDHDEMYVLDNIELRPECDDKCPCLAGTKCMQSSSSVKDKQDNFVIRFTLLPEHKSLSPDNKIIYRCDVCDSAYNHAFSLKRHYLSVHVNHRYLSKSDILSCQIETFHTDIEPRVKLETDGVVKHSETDSVVKHSETDGVVKHSETDGVVKHSETDGVVKRSEMTHSETEGGVKNNEAGSIVKLNEKEGIVKHSETDGVMKHSEADSVVKHSEADSVVKYSEADTTVKHGKSEVVNIQSKVPTTRTLPNAGQPEMLVDISGKQGKGIPAQYKNVKDNIHSEAMKSVVSYLMAKESCVEHQASLPTVCNEVQNTSCASDICSSAEGIEFVGSESLCSESLNSESESPESVSPESAVNTFISKNSDGTAVTADLLSSCLESGSRNIVKDIIPCGDPQNCQVSGLGFDQFGSAVLQDKPCVQSETDKADSGACETASGQMETQGEIEQTTRDQEKADCEIEQMTTKDQDKADCEIRQTTVSPLLSAHDSENVVDLNSNSLEQNETSDIASSLHRVYLDCQNSTNFVQKSECDQNETSKSDGGFHATSVADCHPPNVCTEFIKKTCEEAVECDQNETSKSGGGFHATSVADCHPPDVCTEFIKNTCEEAVKCDQNETSKSGGGFHATSVADCHPPNVCTEVIKSTCEEAVEEKDFSCSHLNNQVMTNPHQASVDYQASVDCISTNVERTHSTTVERTHSTNVERTHSTTVHILSKCSTEEPSVDDTNSVNTVSPSSASECLAEERHIGDMMSVGTDFPCSISESLARKEQIDDAKTADTLSPNSALDLLSMESDSIQAPAIDKPKLPQDTITHSCTSLITAIDKPDVAESSDGTGSSLAAASSESTVLSKDTITHNGTSLVSAKDKPDVADCSHYTGHSLTVASSFPAVLSEESTGRFRGLSPGVDDGKSFSSQDSVSSVTDTTFPSSKTVTSGSLQDGDVLEFSGIAHEKPAELDSLRENSTALTIAETTSTVTNTSPSVVQKPSTQKLIFVTNLVFPVVSSSHKQPQNRSSSSLVSQSSSPLTTKTSQSATVPLVVISQVPCNLNVQNAASAFLQSSTALKALQTMKNSLNVLNFGSNPPGLSVSVLPSGSKSLVSTSGCDKKLLENSLSCKKSTSTTTTTSSSSPNSCSLSLSKQTTLKPMPDTLNVGVPLTTISSLVFGGSHLTISSTASAKCTSSAAVPLSSISSLVSQQSNVSPIDDQPDDLYRCHMCVRLFKTMNALKLHIRNDPHRFKGGIKQYACLQCSIRFSNKNNLMRHNLMNHPENESYKFRCYTCGKGFMSETYLKMHARFHSGRNFPCKYGCVDMYFPNAATLVKHLRTQHPGLNLKEYLRNAQTGKTRSKKPSCLLGATVEQTTNCLATADHTLETSPNSVGSSQSSTGSGQCLVPSILQYSLNEPGVGFQAKRGRNKHSKATVNRNTVMPPDGDDQDMRGEDGDTEESHIKNKVTCRFRYLCQICEMRFGSHLKLLQHRTQLHGASQSVQEYLYDMSKDTSDESDTGSVKLEFSPPPSPKRFFENVNKRGFENINCYIDGDEDSLKFWQKHLSSKDNTDCVLSSETCQKLEWTTYNFPPCFELREECTAFYDKSTMPCASPKLCTYKAEDVKDKGSWQGHHAASEDSVNEIIAAANLVNQETIHEPSVKKDAKDDRSFTICEKEPCGTDRLQKHAVKGEQQQFADKSHEDNVGKNHAEHTNKSQLEMILNKSYNLMKETDTSGSTLDTETNLVQNKVCSHVKLDTHSQEVDANLLSEEFRVESAGFDGLGSNTEVVSDICRQIVNEIVNNVVIVEKSTNGVTCGDRKSYSYCCEKEQSVSSLDAVNSLSDVDVKVDIKQEVSTEHVQELSPHSGELLDVLGVKLNELPVRDQIDVLKSQSMQGLNLALSEHNHRLFVKKGVLLGNKPVSLLKSWSSQFSIGALDLHSWTSAELQQHVTDLDVNHWSGVVKRKAASLECLTWPHHKPPKRDFGEALDSSLAHSDTSKHDHRRYSIWAGQVHQNFDTTGKDEIFCQPVTEAVRKQEAMREKAQYQFEKSIRDEEIRKKHVKVTQKLSFAESLGLMSRNEFELSYHARREQQHVIKVPEVWNNYENIWFGKKGSITVVCSICHRHFSCWDLCLRHQLKKHPHIEPTSLEMEKDNYVEDMYYYYPMPYGILAQTHLIPDNLPVPEVYVCIRCGFPFKNLSRLHAHIIICDPAQEEAGQDGRVKKVSYMKKKLLPMMDRRLHQQVEQPKIKVSKSLKQAAELTVGAATDTKSLPLNGKLKKSKAHHSDCKLVTEAVQNCSGYSAPFSFYSGKKGNGYELLYNPQNHTRRRELYKILDQHQCHGCKLKFNSLSMLERHVNKCSGRDKLQNQKPLLSGILPDDVALRKQHTCRYCGKRFTYIKGVDLHYKRICAVRKVKEEDNLLTEEDLAHEAELKRIIEHIKWSKSLNQDSRDIIQGHVRVEEDGTLTRVVKEPDLSQGFKKKVKKKGFKWTALKRHRPEDGLASASSTSSSTQSSPVVATEDDGCVVDGTVPDTSDIVNTARRTRLTRSTGNRVTCHNSVVSNKRQASTDRGTAGKKAKTTSKSSVVNLPSKNNCRVPPPATRSQSDSYRHGARDKAKKSAAGEVKEVSGSKQSKSTKGASKPSKVSAANSGPRPSSVRHQIVNSAVSPPGSKPPARKRGKPKRFDPSDMESSYKKKRKDEECVSHPTKLYSGGKTRNTNGGAAKHKTDATVKAAHMDQSSHVLRKTSSRSSTDCSSSASTSKLSVEKNVFPNKEVENKLLEKMNRLKEAAKCESRKSNQKRKTPIVLFSSHASKKRDPGDKHDNKGLKSVSKVASSSELFKHLTTNETILHKNSPQKLAPKRQMSASIDCAGSGNGSQPVSKRLKITTQNITGKSPAKVTVSSADTDADSPETKLWPAAHKSHHKSQESSPEVASATSAHKSTSGAGVGIRGILSKASSPVSKSPTVTVKVVTLSPNGSNLLTYDSAADVPQSSLLLAKPGAVVSHSSPAQQILKCLPQKPIQVIRRSSGSLPGAQLQKTNHEVGIKIISREKFALTNSAAHDLHQQAVKTLVIADSDIRINKSSSQVIKQEHASQADFSCELPSSSNGRKSEFNYHVVCDQENKISLLARKTEGQLSDNVIPSKMEQLATQTAVDVNLREHGLARDSLSGQVVLTSTESSQLNCADPVTSKQSGRHSLQTPSESEFTILCHADMLRKPSQPGAADENLPAGHNQVVVSNVSTLLASTKPQSQVPKRQSLIEQTRTEVAKTVQSLSHSHVKCSNITSAHSLSLPVHGLGNSSSPASSHESVPSIVIPSSTVKVHTVSNTAAAKSVYPGRFRSPTNVVTVASSVIPNLGQGSIVRPTTRIVKLGGVGIHKSCLSPAQPQIRTIGAHYKQMPNATSLLPKIVTQKPLVLSTEQLSRLVTSSARHQHTNAPQVITQTALRQSMVNIAASQTTTASQRVPGQCLSKAVISPQIYVPQSSVANSAISGTQPLNVANLGTSVSVTSMKPKQSASISLIGTQPSMPASNQIMFSLDDGTTAMLDPDSLAHFLTVSPSLSRSDLYAAAPTASAVHEYTSPVILNVTESLSNQNVGEINWPANGTVDLTDIPDTIIE